MKIGFVINDLATELAGYTTTHLAMTATNRGHEAWYIPVTDFSLDVDEHVHAWAWRPPRDRYRSASRFLDEIRSGQARAERICVDEFDVLMLRNDPALDLQARPWARLAGINFGRLAARNGVIVLNDPDGLNHAVNKIYLQLFPKSLRPRTLVSRNRDDIKAFVREEGGSAVIKPLAGSGGRKVFLVSPEERANLNQMIDAVLTEGYVIAQEYLPEAAKGDTRLFLMNGNILEVGGKIAALHRVTPVGDMRSNLTVGGRAEGAEITEAMRALAEEVRPKLIQDGMFLVGLDVVGDKLMEINVFSPGGLVGASRLAGVNFLPPVIAALERKVELRRSSSRPLANVELAAQVA